MKTSHQVRVNDRLRLSTLHAGGVLGLKPVLLGPIYEEVKLPAWVTESRFEPVQLLD